MPELDCLAYSCGNIQQLQPGAVFAPYIQVGFEGEGTILTVGNKSHPEDNHAIIKSLEYGFSEGCGVKLEIVDEQGSSISFFMERLSKTACGTSFDYRMFIDFGWIIQDCNGNITYDKVTSYGRYLYFLPQKVECSFEGEKIKYTIEGTDLQDRIAENRIENNLGAEDNKMNIKQAIEDMFSDNCPPIEDVRFETLDGFPWSFKNSDGGPQGPRAVWTSDQQNGLATTRKWIAPLSTRDDKGIVFQWKPDEPRPTLVLLEDPDPGPNENDPCCERNVGTFIVNGGNASNVISFTPQFSWALQSNGGSGGNSGSATSGAGIKQVGREGSQIERVGTQTQFPPNQSDNMWRPNNQIGIKAQEANANHEAAVRFREVPTSISGELKIMGDPSFAFPLGAKGLVGKHVSIIYVNPFHIKNSGDTAEWVATPPCNETISNKKWMIQSANHQIKEGSYVTTLKLFLHKPNSELEPFMPLGGFGCSGNFFENAIGQTNFDE
jgi:hypothetical protein